MLTLEDLKLNRAFAVVEDATDYPVAVDLLLTADDIERILQAHDLILANGYTLIEYRLPATRLTFLDQEGNVFNGVTLDTAQVSVLQDRWWIETWGYLTDTLHTNWQTFNVLKTKETNND